MPPLRLCLTAAAVTLACLTTPLRALAQPWGEIELPGGVTAARQVLGLGNETRTGAAFLVDFVRTFHQFGDVDSAAIEGFERYLRYVQRLRSALAVWPDGMQLGKDRLRGEIRDRWRMVAETLGLRLREVKNRPVLEVDRDDEATRRASWLKALGVDTTRLAQQLNQGERVRIVVPSDALPLPLPAMWPELLDRPGPADVVALGAHHRSALLYVGLMALDAETLTFVARHPKVLDLDMAETGTFAAFARSIRVRGNRVEPAGGAAYAPAWVQFVDRRLEEPVDFIRRLLGKDDGRLAFLYDTVAHASPRLQAALFDGAPGTDQRLEILDRHYRSFKTVEEPWKVGTRPFYRPAIDPPTALALLDIGDDGTVGAPWWPAVLQKIVEDDGWPDRPLRDIDDRRAGVTWALGWIFDATGSDIAARFRLLRFFQRQFARAPRTAAAEVEVALRTMRHMPALALALERMGVDDPALLAEVAEAAMRLTRAGDIDTAGPRLRQWQAALSILEQVGRRRAFPASVRDGLLASLGKVVPADRELPPGAVAEWVIEQLAPALGAPSADVKGYEAAAIAAWLAPADAPAHTLTWEGLDYRVDRVGPVVRDAVAVRAGARGPTLGHLELLVSTRREMARGVKTLDRAKAVAQSLEVVKNAVVQLRDDRNKPRFETDDLEDATRTVARIRRERNLDRVPKQVTKLRYTFDVVTAYVLPALAYALAAAPTPQPQIYGDIAERHLVTAALQVAPDEWRRAAWVLPAAGTLPSGGAGMLGSLLALDVALADGQLRRMATAEASAPPAEGKFTPQDRDALTARLLYATAPDAAENAGAEARRAIDAGRSRWTEIRGRAMTARAEVEAALAPLVGETRTNLMLWLLARNQADAVDEMLLPSELARLGSAGSAVTPGLLGISGTAFDGCLCLREPPARPISEWLGRGDSGHLSVLTADVTLRVLQALAELKLPALLAEPLLPFALQDVIDRISQFSHDDWEAVAVARFIPKERVEEYVLALVAEGILAPPAPRER